MSSWWAHQQLLLHAYLINTIQSTSYSSPNSNTIIRLVQNTILLVSDLGLAIYFMQDLRYKIHLAQQMAKKEAQSFLIPTLALTSNEYHKYTQIIKGYKILALLDT
jgi:uncharacterized integral membrane protein